MAKKPIKKKPQQKVAPAEKKSKVDPKSTVDNTSGALIDCLAGDKKVTKLSPPTLFKIDVEDDGGAIQDPLTKLLQPFGNRDLSSTKITNTSSITDVDAKFSSIAFKLSSRIDMIDGGLANLNKKFDSAIGQLNKKYEAEHKSSVQNYRKLEAQLSDIKQPTYGRGGLETKGGQKITGGGVRLPFSGTDLAALALLVFPHLKKNYLDPFFAKYDKEIGNLTNSIADNRAAVEAARKAARMTSGAVTAGRTVAKGVGAAVKAVTPPPAPKTPTPKTYGTPGATTSFSGAPQSTPVPTAKPKLKKVPLGAIINNKLTRSTFGILLKKLPVIGLGAAMIDAGVRIGRGDRQGAALAAGSGIAGLLPGFGTVTSFAADLTLIAHDIFKEVHGRHPDLTDPEDIKEMGRIYEHIGKTRKSNEAHIKDEISKSNNQTLRQSDEKTFMAAMAKTGQMRRGQYTGMEMDEQVASTTKGGYLFGMIGGTKVPGKTITLDQNRQVPAYDMNMGRMNLGAKGVPGTAAGSSNYMAQFAGSAGITTPPLPMQRQMAMMPPLPTMKPQPLSFASNSFRERVYQQKSQFMQFGAMPGGFENVMGNRGILGKPVMVAASGAQPFGGGFGGGDFGGGSGGPAYSGVSTGPSNSTIVNPKTGNLTNASSEYTPVGFGENITVDKRGNVNKTEMRNYLIKRIASSKLNGYVPPDGKENGILKGAPEEWANYYMRLGMVESSLKVTTHGDKGRFGGHGSRGLFQLSPADAINHGIQKKPFSYEQLADPKTNIDATIAISENVMLGDGKKWKGRGSIRRGMGRYWGPVRRGWTPNGTKRDAQMFANNKDAWQRQDTARAEAGAVESELDVNSTAFRTPGMPKSEMGPGYDDFGPSAGTDVATTPTPMVKPAPIVKPVSRRTQGEARKIIEADFQRRLNRADATDTLTQDMSNVRRRKSKEEEARVRARQRRGGRSVFNQAAKNAALRERAGLSGRDSKQNIRANLETVRLPNGKKFKTNKLTAKRFQPFINEAMKRGYNVDGYIGSLAFRTKRGGRSKSMHYYGSAVDFNPGANPFRSNKTDMHPDMVKLAEIYGLVQLQGDNMHFEPASDATWKGLLLTHLENGTIGRDHPSVKSLLDRGVFKETEIAKFEEFGKKDKELLESDPYYAQKQIDRMRKSGEITSVAPSEEPAIVDVDIDGVPIIAPDPPPSDAGNVGSDPREFDEDGNLVKGDMGAPATVVQPSQSDPLDIGATPTVKAPEPPPPTNDAKSAILAMDVTDKKADEQTEATRIKRDDEAKKAKDDDRNNSSRTRSAGGQGGSGQHHPEQEAPRAGSSGYGASGRCWV